MKRFGLPLLLFAFAVPAAAQQDPPAPPDTPDTQVASNKREEAKPPLSPREEMKLRADVYMARKFYPEAIELYTELLGKDPKNARLLNMVGNAYLHLGEFKKAKKYYQRAMKADKTYDPAVNNLGVMHYQIRKYRQAAKLYRKAIQLDPQNASYHRNLGFAFFEQKKYEDAMLAFYQGLLLDPLLFERRGQGGSVLQHSVGADDRPVFFFSLAKTYALLGDAERCALFLRKARDEGYPRMDTVETDPVFAKVIESPLIQQILHPEQNVLAAPPGA